MRRKKSWILAIMAAAFLAFTTGGCVEPLDSNVPGIDPDAVKLPIRLYIPGSMPATKASPGDVDGVHPESQIYSVQVWMFNHPTYDGETLVRGGDNETAVAYAVANNLTGQSANLPNGSGYYKGTNGYTTGGWTDEDTYELSMWIPGHVIDRPANDMKFDFYVLANGGSIESTADPSTTRGALKAMTFGFTSTTSDFFGVSSPKTGTSPEIAINGSVGANGPGLPISGFFNKKNNGETQGTGIDLSILKTRDIVSDEDVHTYSPIVQLKRAVSKIQFAFVRPKGMAGVQITKIVIDEKLIPDNTFVFPREDGTDGTSGYSYNTAATTIQGSLNGNTRLPLLADTDIKEMTDAVPDPKSLESTSETAVPGYSVNVAPKNMSAQQYSDLLNAFATSQLVYLRESGKKIKGKIYYKLSADGDEKSAVFEMDADDDDTNFLRNHSWTVYGYFKGGSLYVIPHIMKWTVASEISYESAIGVSLAPQESYRKRTDIDASQYGYISVSSGYIRTTYNDGVPIETLFYDNPTENDRPAKAHRITLKTKTSGEDLQLSMDNPNYRFVIFDVNTQKYDYSLNPGEPLRITGTPDDEGWITTYYYVVPVTTLPSDAPDFDKICHVSLTTTSTSIGALRIPYNNSALPGASEGSDEVWFYYTSPDVYATTGVWVVVE